MTIPPTKLLILFIYFYVKLHIKITIMTELEMFTKLPQLNEDYEISDIDIDYTPTLSSINKEQYYVYWRGFAAKDLGVHLWQALLEKLLE